MEIQQMPTHGRKQILAGGVFALLTLVSALGAFVYLDPGLAATAVFTTLCTIIVIALPGRFFRD